MHNKTNKQTNKQINPDQAFNNITLWSRHVIITLVIIIINIPCFHNVTFTVL